MGVSRRFALTAHPSVAFLCAKPDGTFRFLQFPLLGERKGKHFCRCHTPFFPVGMRSFSLRLHLLRLFRTGACAVLILSHLPRLLRLGPHLSGTGACTVRPSRTFSGFCGNCKSGNCKNLKVPSGFAQRKATDGCAVSANLRLTPTHNQLPILSRLLHFTYYAPLKFANTVGEDSHT